MDSRKKLELLVNILFTGTTTETRRKARKLIRKNFGINQFVWSDLSVAACSNHDAMQSAKIFLSGLGHWVWSNNANISQEYVMWRVTNALEAWLGIEFISDAELQLEGAMQQMKKERQ